MNYDTATRLLFTSINDLTLKEIEDSKLAILALKILCYFENKEKNNRVEKEKSLDEMLERSNICKDSDRELCGIKFDTQYYELEIMKFAMIDLLREALQK